MKHLMLVILIFLSMNSLAAPKVTLMVYVDMSGSMSDHRTALAALSGAITRQLKRRCGEFEVAVSNINYLNKLGHLTGGELIFPPEETPFLNSEQGLNYVKDQLSKRISYNNDVASHLGTKTYQTGAKELTYTSVLATLDRHLLSSTEGPKGKSTLGILILSDAAPFFERLHPQVAFDTLRQQTRHRDVMVGSLGASESCADVPFAPHTPQYEQHSHKRNWLNDFARVGGGYPWNMCAETNSKTRSPKFDFEQSVEDFIIMLMEKAKCQVLV